MFSHNIWTILREEVALEGLWGFTQAKPEPTADANQAVHQLSEVDEVAVMSVRHAGNSRRQNMLRAKLHRQTMAAIRTRPTKDQREDTERTES